MSEPAGNLKEEVSPGLDALGARYVAWMRDAQQRGAETTRRAARWISSWECYLASRGRDPTTATADDAAAYLGELRDSGRYQPSTLAQAVSTLRGYHQWLCDRRKVQANTWTSLRRPRIPERVPRVLSVDQVDRLLGAPHLPTFRDARDRALLELLYSTGARSAEVCAVRIRDVDLDGGRVILFGKWSKERLGFLSPRCVRALQAYLAWLPREQPVNAPLLQGIRGKPLYHEVVRDVVARAARRAKLGHVNPHALRHAYATHLLDGGADIRYVQELLGHARLQTTQIYTHVSKARLEAAYRAAHPLAGEDAPPQRAPDVPYPAIVGRYGLRQWPPDAPEPPAPRPAPAPDRAPPRTRTRPGRRRFTLARHP